MKLLLKDKLCRKHMKLFLYIFILLSKGNMEILVL